MHWLLVVTFLFPTYAYNTGLEGFQSGPYDSLSACTQSANTITTNDKNAIQMYDKNPIVEIVWSCIPDGDIKANPVNGVVVVK